MDYKIFGEKPPSPFLERIYKDIAECWTSVGSLACKVTHKENCCCIMCFPAIREVNGGSEDGQQGFAGFNLDISRFSRIFDTNPSVYFDCLRKDFIEHLRFKGLVGGKEVDIAFLLTPPPNQQPLERVYLYGPKKGTIEAI